MDVRALLARRREARAILLAGIDACRTLLRGSARDDAHGTLRAAVRAVGAWEVHARGAIVTRTVGADAAADARVVLEALLASGERLLRCFPSEDGP
jgi:hypothetical protein